MIGTTLSHFRITAKLGEGGMGEVYRAEDTKLGREVAIKVLPEAVANDPERLARFEREAKILASLNHPNIAGIHSLESAGEGLAPESVGEGLAPSQEGTSPSPTKFLVMELAEGTTLATRLAHGPFPLDEALPIALQIAQALEAAHERGVIHRDLKPANVMLAPDGQVKVLDFGLAKALEPAPLSGENVGEPLAGSREGASLSPTALSLSPTLTAQMTQPGVILGTAAYMSPEQARGKVVDTRTDIFSFGIVLYQMLTGKKAFAGDEVSDLLASILKTEPDWQALPVDLDSRVQNILRRCLRKDRKTRRQSIGDIRVEIQEIMAGPADSPAVPQPAGLRRQISIGAAALILGMLIAGVLWWAPDRAPPSPVRFTITTAGELPRASGPLLGLSADGRSLVYSASQRGTRQLHLRQRDQFESSPIAGTEDAGIPFLSPDGQWIGFGTARALRKVLTTGGTATTVCECGAARSAAWGPDDTIYFTGASSALAAISAAGGTPRPVTTLEGDETTHRGVSVLPNGRAILFAALSGGRETARIVAQSLDTGDRRVLVDGTHPRYVPTGHLLFARSDALWAVPFDVDRLTVSGEPIPVVEGIRQEPVGAVQYEVSQEGTLVYVPSLQDAALPDSLLWVDREGGATPLTADRGVYSSLGVSPNGREIVLQIAGEDGSENIWVLDIERGTIVPLTTGNALSQNPVWSPDGARIAFRAESGPTGSDLHWTALSGGEPENLLQRDYAQTPSSWSPDGTLLAFDHFTPEKGNDIWVFSLADTTPSPFLETRASESSATFSPDGRWVAYVSDESGDFEVYITSYPEPGRRIRVSTAGGHRPRWSADGTELFYLTADGEIMAVPMLSEESSPVAPPERLFQLPGTVDYDAHPDGKRFVMIQRSASSESSQINVVQNWFEELKRLVPSN